MEEEGCGGKLLSEFFLRSLFSVCLKRDLGGNLILSTWLASIGWRKTPVFRNSLIERFLLIFYEKHTRLEITSHIRGKSS